MFRSDGKHRNKVHHVALPYSYITALEILASYLKDSHGQMILHFLVYFAAILMKEKVPLTTTLTVQITNKTGPEQLHKG